MKNSVFFGEDTIVALATPAGVGAIGVIRLSGKDAFNVLSKLFFTKSGKPIDLNKKKSHTLHFGIIKDHDEVLDEVLVSVFVGPNSYTGEHVVEISCHGSVFIQQQLINLFIANGARMANPGEYTLRAFLHGKLDLSQAEAVADLIASENFATHNLAIKQLKGGFSHDIKELRDQLIHFASLIELELDFSEEDVEFANRSDLKALVNAIIVKSNQLIGSFEAGNVIKNGIPVAIIGKPNAGKSTLLNALLNEEKAIVSDIAGTTRDVIEDVIAIQGISFRFIDTAGIRLAQDKIEAIGIERTHQKMMDAAIILYIFDVNELSEIELMAAMNDLKSKATNQQRLLIIGNKIDEKELIFYQNKFSSIPEIIFISAKEKKHIDGMIHALMDYVKSKNIDMNTTIITNSRHLEALNNSVQSLNKVMEGLASNITGDFIASDIRNALYYLGLISGEVTTDDLLKNIFSRFCIGK
ncbi:MAG: tRNA uridine-5-carboxymethylaminomethyl(34) synthesis GTPase MnmE [Bacteroidota bacterium]